MKKVAVITGGRTGIGRATIERFQGQGFQVINLSRKPAGIDGCTSLIADFSHPDWLSAVEKPLKEQLKGCEQLAIVHNAGVHVNDHVLEIEPEEMRRSLEVNVVAPAILNRFLAPYLVPGSAIVYIGSTLSEKAVFGCTSYVTAKHAVVGMMRSTCQDLAGRQVHTACVCPGFTDTDMLREHVGGSAEVLKDIASVCTYNRLIEPAEIADTIYFCATNPVINGAVLHANLGQVEH
ncbi:SDR family oxidoreductase [Aestuariicella hydrocarbonica]|uniref:SDR family oxidoreductase n=1 Tax=Pseudomaricurvus hydrocarbonicus TaxID=1470433 RepID=A0A9E5JWQ0_9GAMM|nr:SDR family oxidoreductase [Aestuariicella hydrocarbonica]NHO65910.1 SDR family oxidoreductase [Aestuariicella hydrocarbonica]